MKTCIRHLALAAGATAMAWFAAGGPAFALECAELTTEALGLEGVTIVEAEAVAADDRIPVDHCLIEARTAERTGLDCEPYALGFEMRLPDKWNGRFFHQFNGDDGEIIPAIGLMLGGNVSRIALGRGYAVLSSDGGHNRGLRHDDGLLTAHSLFGLDPRARSFYGYKAVEIVAPLAKKLIAAYYGRPAERSYGVGCSNGGRHALMAAERLPDQYDGFLAGAPGFNLPKAALQHALDVQTFKPLTGDIRTAFAPTDLSLVADAIRSACDRLDGTEDGMVLDTGACQTVFDIDTLLCSTGQDTSCLTSGKIEALKTVHAGPVDSEGKQLYSDWPWDAGIGGTYWRFWKLESTLPTWEEMPIIATMGAATLAHVFTTPPEEVASTPAALENFLLDFDLDRDAANIHASEDPFTESAMDFAAPPGVNDPTLDDFKAAGGKMIIFHGMSDPYLSPNDTERWYEKLAANNGGSAADFVKYYGVPGMNHCAGGPATDDFDFFTALVDWVENGVEPQAVIAGLMAENPDIPENWSKERTRQLCPWPQVARYRGGDLEKAESFICAD
ncbi:tannase/feruloyl esterase family alpha/beta hydrolase [Mesorhizobium xinjiangense]|uniref:tannase/feruloyl esterase family alpha/beta hydrolase n=1 Tax=Mesorhizobium xinjiangense TaxID=2678685 RepID=UPI0012ED5F20|nr:tannase/feruloyl esterase family alpha/beta hydrolase [Mesorhizobium xinjiangense]